METIGHTRITDRQIFYVSQKEDDWFKQLPNAKWVGFIVCDINDIDSMTDTVIRCIDKNIGYVCTAGKFCEKLHDIFDEEITNRALEIEKQSGKEYDYEDAPMTDWHNNFSEGLWFAMTNANDGDKEFDKIICIDCTKKGVKKYIQSIIEKVNSSWIPSDEEIEEPQYDS